MVLTIDDIVTHFVLSSHPRNRAIVDIKEKKTNKLRYIKIRHRLSIYAVSLVSPITFDVMAEVQAKNALTKSKLIILHFETKPDIQVELRETSRIGFEWTFIWEGERYRWVRESRMSNNLECRAVRKTGDICVAQYLPRVLKDEYFGIISLLGYNMLRCELSQSKELELLLFISLITLLDKSDDASWKRDPISKGIPQEDMPRPPVSERVQQKKQKMERTNEQKLQFMLDKEVRRSQKQIQADQKRYPASTGNSPAHTPKTSPMPTPTASSNSLKLAKRRSVTQSSDNSPLITPTNSSSGTKRLSKLFSSLANVKQQQQSQQPSTDHNRMSIAFPVIDQLREDTYDHQHTFPYYSHSLYGKSNRTRSELMSHWPKSEES